MQKRVLFLTAGLMAGLMACTPVINERGYLPDPTLEAAIKTGTDSKTTVQQRLGFPTTQATFGDTTWYYISSTTRQVAFFTPTVTKRSILAVSFDQEDKVTRLARYSLKDGHVVAFETRKTPTPGREMTFIQQLLGSSVGTPNGTSTESQTPGAGSGVPRR